VTKPEKFGMALMAPGGILVVWNSLEVMFYPGTPESMSWIGFAIFITGIAIALFVSERPHSDARKVKKVRPQGTRDIRHLWFTRRTR
jgi:hypothetical protein